MHKCLRPLQQLKLNVSTLDESLGMVLVFGVVSEAHTMDIFQTVHGKKGGLTSWQVMLLPRKAEGESGGPKVKVKVYYLPVSRSEASEASRVCKSDLCGVEDRC